MKSTDTKVKQEHLEREHLARHHTIAVLDARARVIQAELALDDLTHELSTPQRRARADQLVTLIEQLADARAAGR